MVFNYTGFVVSRLHSKIDINTNMYFEDSFNLYAHFSVEFKLDREYVSVMDGFICITNATHPTDRECLVLWNWFVWFYKRTLPGISFF
jgi:hypothetical protein